MRISPSAQVRKKGQIPNKVLWQESAELRAPLCPRPVATFTGKARALDSYGGVTAALKRTVELKPTAEGRSFQVVIDGERT